MIKHIPNFITSLNLAAGFLAIIFISSGDTVTASWLIFAAMIFDFLDGFSARILKAYSEIGKELDSLADVVSFGVAPAFIVFTLIKGSLSSPVQGGILFTGDVTGNILLLSTVLMPVFAALRLAKFNIDTTQATTFKGLPTPANAIAVISLVLGSEYSDWHLLDNLVASPIFLSILTIVLSFLMVSRIPLLSLKTSNLGFRGNEGRYFLVAMVLIALITGGIGSVSLIIPIYILASLLSLFF